MHVFTKGLTLRNESFLRSPGRDLGNDFLSIIERILPVFCTVFLHNLGYFFCKKGVKMCPKWEIWSVFLHNLRYFFLKKFQNVSKMSRLLPSYLYSFIMHFTVFYLCFSSIFYTPPPLPPSPNFPNKSIWNFGSIFWLARCIYEALPTHYFFHTWPAVLRARGRGPAGPVGGLAWEIHLRLFKPKC